MLQEPFYGHYLTGLQKVSQPLSEDNGDKAPLTLQLHNMTDVQVTVNDVCWQALTPEQQLGALKHEVLHLVLGHLTLRGDFADKARFDLAADLVVNQYLPSHQLATNAATLESLNRLRQEAGLAPLSRGRDVAFYYQALAQGIVPPSAASQAQSSGHGDATASNATGKTSDEGENLAAPPVDWQPSHASWQPFAQLEKFSQSLLKQQLAHKQVQMAERVAFSPSMREQLPGIVLEALQSAVEARRAIVDWRRLLRLFTNSSRKTRVKNTLRRPSRRYGTTPGIKIQSQQHVLVAIDTSASVNHKQLATFFTELNHIWRAGAEITVVECDSEIQRTYSYKGEPPQNVSGRGGTEFTPVIAEANRLRVDAIVYFTDGEAPPPQLSPRAPLLWLIHTHANNTATLRTDLAALRRYGRVIPMTSTG
ncbi:vWA domain-containing protein [Ferrimonas pelagia]|uniref:Metal-dependent peptidase n=1 Tax=Ferrimonas pelagia TaxID=1177826 RepID=A0ABP9F3D4_9GAMM